MTEKRTTMIVMPNKIAKSQQEIFDRAISPVLDKLVQICDKNGIAMQFTAQLESTNDDLNLVTEALYTNKSNQLFQVIDMLSHGKLNVIVLPDGDYYLRTTDIDDEAAHDKSVISKLPFVLPWDQKIH